MTIFCGMGYVQWAWREARRRYGFSGFVLPRPREWTMPGENRHAEFYRILDAAALTFAQGSGNANARNHGVKS